MGGPVPSPGQLAAYVDGELDAAGCRQVEIWLAAHPEAAAEVEGCRRLARLWQSAAPPEPAPAAWAAAWGRVEAALPMRAPARTWGAGRPYRGQESGDL